MNRTLPLLNSLAAITLATLSIASTAWGGAIYFDNGTQMTDSPANAGPAVPSGFANTAGAQIRGIVSTPFDTTVTGANVILAATKGANAIYAYSPAGVRSTFALVSSPIGLAIDPTGHVYTAAGSGDTIEKFAPNGAGGPTVVGAGLESDALAVDWSGNLFEADDDQQIMEYVGGGGSPTTFASLPHGTNFFGMAFDSSENLFVSYWQTQTTGGIYEITPTGVVSSFTVTSFLPTGLAFDATSGDLYVSYVDTTGGGTGGANVYVSGSGGLSTTPAVFIADGSGNPYAIGDQAPEPGTLLLLGGGLLSGLVYRYRHLRVS